LNLPRLSFDTDALKHNVAAWRRVLGTRELWPVLKSDAYGMGLERVAQACVEAGVPRLCVIDIGEARRLRAAGVNLPIVQVTATTADEIDEAVQLRVIASIEDEQSARRLSRAAGEHGSVATAHIAVETGTGWSGVPYARAATFATMVGGLPGLRWEGAWTHISGREKMDSQTDRFAIALAAMRAAGLPLPMDHIASTAPTLWGAAGAASRIGIGLYGSTFGGSSHGLGLRTALHVTAPVVYVREFERETPLGYGSASVAQAGESIATLRIGYSDGLPRALSVGGRVRLGDELCPIVGSIGMNFTMVKLSYAAAVKLGDEALVIGDAEGVRLDEVANRAGTIPHQLLTSLAVLSSGASA
jgi:alanine racemase